MSEVKSLVTFRMRGGFGPTSDYRLKMTTDELPQEFFNKMDQRMHPNIPNLLVVGEPGHLVGVNLTFVQHMDVATLEYLKEQAAKKPGDRAQLELDTNVTKA